MSLVSPAKEQVLTSKIDRLKDRASMLKRARRFFEERCVLEVDCPHLTAKASVDEHIDLIPAIYKSVEMRFLHSSPEYGMKRLLADGIGDIFQLAHVFRDGERGAKHNPEFMLAEWYRIGFTFEQMYLETLDFIRLFLGKIPHSIISYRELFQRYAGFDYLTMTDQDLIQYIEKVGISAYPSLYQEGKDALLNLILGSRIESQLGNGELCVLTHYPSSQAALAQKKINGDEEVAERFEIYYRGLELANGYHELSDPNEQRQRFEEANETLLAQGKNIWPIDEFFLEALHKGLPDCCGVAVGFDRLMMLRHDQTNIDEVITWGWDEA